MKYYLLFISLFLIVSAGIVFFNLTDDPPDEYTDNTLKSSEEYSSYAVGNGGIMEEQVILTQQGQVSESLSPLNSSDFKLKYPSNWKTLNITEKIEWLVLVKDKNGKEKIEDVFATIGSSQGAGNDIEVNCQEKDLGSISDKVISHSWQLNLSLNTKSLVSLP